MGEPNTTAVEIIKCGNMVSSDRGLSETADGKQMVFVPREAILKIELCYGCSAHRPIVECCIGAVLIGVGMYGGYGIFYNRALRYDLGMVALGIIGVSLILEVMRKHYYLAVSTRSETLKLRFSKKTSAEEIAAFCEQLRARWNYTVIRQVSPARGGSEK